MILSKLFLPEGRMWRVKRNEDKKAGKKRRKRSKRKFGTLLAKKGPNFGLCACTKVKFCTLLHGISVKMLLQGEKVL